MWIVLSLTGTGNYENTADLDRDAEMGFSADTHIIQKN